MTREECAKLKKGDKLYYSGFAEVFKVTFVEEVPEDDGFQKWFTIQSIDNLKHQFCINAKYSRRLLLDRLRKVEYKKLRSYG